MKETITSSRKFSREMTKKSKKKYTESGYLLTVSTGEEVFVRDEEAYRYGLYEIPEDGRDCCVFEEILMKRMLSALLEFVCFKKRTVSQIKEKAVAAVSENEPFLNQFTDAALDKLIVYMKENGYADDLAAGRSVVRRGADSRLSVRMIRSKLSEIGISEQDADILLEEIYIDENKAALELGRKKLGFIPGEKSVTEKEKVSLYRFLTSKGYGNDAVCHVLSEYGKGNDYD